jgi:riboflavin kinase/FMN adenylyltransferase
MRRQAEARGLQPAVFTFRNHPRHVLRPGTGPTLLTTFEERIELLQACGVETVFYADFTPELARVSAASFMSDWLSVRMRARAIAVGPNYRFGHQAQGTPASLMQQGFAVDQVEPLAQGAEPVSSTRIRALVGEGRMEAAAALLSRPYFMTGTVERGDARGVELGAPTANLPVDLSKQLPPHGVYAVRVRRRGDLLAGVANLGTRPTFDKKELLLEVHLLDRRESLYGETLQVSFVSHLRAEQKFPDADALRTQIRLDVERARAALALPS